MGTTEGKIYKAIPCIMSEINAVEKNKKNKQQGFMYRGIDDVMNAINPALVKHNVFIVPEVMEQSREERKSAKGINLLYSVCRMKFRFCADDGSYIEAVTVGEGMDSGAKATNKAMAVAFKYACFQVFCIPTEEMKDPDAETPEPSSRAEQEKKDNSRETAAEVPGQAGSTAYGHGTVDALLHLLCLLCTGSTAYGHGTVDAHIDVTKVNALRDKAMRKGVGEKSILEYFRVESFSSMDFEVWNKAMQLLDRYKDVA